MNEIDKRLQDISKIIDIDYLLNEKNTEKTVKSYYNTNKLTYRIFHNNTGYIHMGLSNDDKYSYKDLEISLLEIEKLIQKSKAKKVLELASGHGANTIFLASRNKETEFFAIDLSTKPKRKFYQLKNTNFKYGDFHKLTMYKDNSFDLIFIIESLCHSNNKKKALEEIYRLLKVGGKVIIYDGYYGIDYKKLSENEKKASILTSAGMAVGNFGYLKEFEKDIKNTGFEIIEKKDLSMNIIPTLKRFERMSAIFF